MFPIFPASKVLYMPDIYLEYVSDFCFIMTFDYVCSNDIKSIMDADNFFPFNFSLKYLHFCLQITVLVLNNKMLLSPFFLLYMVPYKWIICILTEKNWVLISIMTYFPCLLFCCYDKYQSQKHLGKKGFIHWEKEQLSAGT